MKIVRLDLQPDMQIGEPIDGIAGLTHIETTFTMTVAPESEEEAELLKRVPPGMGTIEYLRQVAELVQPPITHRRNSVVSIRPQVDGAPTSRMIVAPDDTCLFPLVLAAIAPSGELLRLGVTLEIQAQ